MHEERWTKKMGGGAKLYDDNTGISGHFFERVGGGGDGDGSLGGDADNQAAMTVHVAGNPMCVAR